MKTYRALRRGRAAAAVLATAAVSAAVGLGIGAAALRMQLVPAILAGSVAWLGVWGAATLLLGRIYCSTACPMGALMDASARIFGRRNQYHYEPARTRTRVALCVAVAAGYALGLGGVASLLEPYSAFARAVAAPAAAVRHISAVGVASAVVALLTVVVVAAVAARHGRRLCNTVCPVGTLLGAVGRRAVLHADVNTDLCTGCLRCVQVCKAGCIDPSTMTVDTSRCVVCFRCMDACPTGAMTYRAGRHRVATPLMQPTAAAGPVAMDRREFLRRGAVVAAAVAAGAAGLKAAPKAWDPEPLSPLNLPLPPGNAGRRHYLRHCTACGACTGVCPTGVLRSSGGAMGPTHALQPAMMYGTEACRTDCNACTRACPTGALTPLTLSEKRRFVMGKARIRLQNCIAYGLGRHCGRCARRCPYGAIAMIQYADGRRGPHLDMDRCTGCGQCQMVCPATPYKAITIEGE